MNVWLNFSPSFWRTAGPAGRWRRPARSRRTGAPACQIAPAPLAAPVAARLSTAANSPFNIAMSDLLRGWKACRALLIYPTCQTLYPHIGFNCQFYGGVYIYSASRMINTADADAASRRAARKREPKHGFAAHRQSRRHHRIRPRHRLRLGPGAGARRRAHRDHRHRPRLRAPGCRRLEGSRLRGHRHRAGRLRRRPGAGHGRRGSAPTAASTSWSTTPASPATSTCSRCRKRTGTPWSTPS